MKAEIQTITPHEATQMLDANKLNRNVRNTRVETYARDMRAKKWILNGDAIKFNGNGKLLDGQHRLLACVRADVPFQTLVVTGLTDRAHATIDTGMTRTIADELRWRGEKNVNVLGAALNLLWHYDRAESGFTVASRNDLLSLLEKEPDIRRSLEAIPVARRVGINGSAMVAAAYIAGREHGQDTVESFLAELDRGTGYEEGDPCLALRNYAVRIATNRLLRLGQYEWLAIVIKAYNFWALGRPVKSLAWKRVGRGKENFPQVVSREMLSE